MKRKELLQRLKRSRKIPIEIAELIIQISVPRYIKNKNVLVDIDTKCQDIFFVLEGGFVCQYLTEYGNFKTVNFYLHNFQPFVTIPSSYFFNTASNFRLKAIMNTSILCISNASITTYKNKFPEFSEWYYQMIIEALVEEIECKTELITLSCVAMYKRLLKSRKEIILQVPSIYIAEYLGISRQHLSRLKASIYP